ncbi:MAG: CaiB/BaiF CoA transferase family protein [Acidimicrobiales bacterium]
MVTGPLSDILVVDLSRVLAGPYAAMMLGDMGARVIKVERPGFGDDTRAWGPPFAGSDDAKVSTYFLSINRNKESITLDLKAAADVALLHDLLSRADVLIENFSPGVMERFGLGLESLVGRHQRLVALSITGFGTDGPDAGRAGYDQVLQGEAGLMSVTGPGPGQPTKAGLPVADVLAGAFGAYGVLAALHERERTGRGKLVSTSLLAGVVAAHAYQGTRWLVAGEVPSSSGNHHPSLCPYGAYTCGDGLIQVAVGSDAIWRRFAPLMGIDPHDPRFSSNEARLASRAELDAILADALSGRNRAEWLEVLLANNVPAGVVKTIDEVYGSEQVRSQHLVAAVEHPDLGHVELPGPPVQMEGLREEHQAPPLLGEHDAAVRAWLDQGG